LTNATLKHWNVDLMYYREAIPDVSNHLKTK
jgi:hypothetical protein